MESSVQDQYYELSYYTLSHPDPAFIHQHIVDAYTAQTATNSTKPIAITFALVGLYLYLEKQYTGRQVQDFHIKMSKHKMAWPAFQWPVTGGEITIADVLKAAPGSERDHMIHDWCASVWEAYQINRPVIIALVANFD